METILNNQWVVAIIGGLITSYAVIVINDLRRSGRKRRELRQRIQLANNEILNSLRPLIAEEELPPATIINSVVTATANKYNVDAEELYSTNSLTDDMITEIMSNSFLSSKQKVSYGKFVLRIKHDENHRMPPGTEKLHYQNKERRDISLIVVGATFSSVCLGILSLLLGAGRITVNQGSIKKTLLFVAAAILIPTIALWAMDVFRDIQELKRVRQDLTMGETNSGSGRSLGEKSEMSNQEN